MSERISVVVPCYNQAEFLEEALQSVLEQTYANWECIIINDGSLDETAVIAAKWIERDKRFRYVFQENAGLSSARNTGISSSSGKYILPLDADDKLAPDYLELAIEAFKADNSIKLVYCRAEKFGADEGPWKLPVFSLFDLSRENMIFCSAVFKRKDWERVGGYDQNMLYGWEDWEFWIAILKDGGKVVRLEQTCFFYRIKTSSMIKNMDSEKEKKMREYVYTKHIAWFAEYYLACHKKNKQLLKKHEADQNKLKSKKYVLNLFSQNFFGFSILKKSK